MLSIQAFRRLLGPAAAMAMIASPLPAQTIWSGDLSVDGRTCTGLSCFSPEDYAGVPLKLKDDNTAIWFDDTSTDPGFPATDWMIETNDEFEGGAGHFSIIDRTHSKQIVNIFDNAPSFSLAIYPDGNVGFGTLVPQKHLHVVDGNSPALRLEQDISGGWPAQTWDLRANELGMAFYDRTAGVTPFIVEPGAPSNALHVNAINHVGFGISTPSSAMHLYRSDGSAQVLIQDTGTPTAPRTMIHLMNNGRPEIVMGNSSTGEEWSFGAGTNFILKQGVFGSPAADKTKLFEIAPSGDATLAGTLTTGGTTCGGGCDRVFSQSHDLPSIDEHAERMFSLGYLPNVGPTVENAPINLTDKLGRMLNELEHAHIYIAWQNAEISEQRNRVSSLQSRMDDQHALIAGLRSDLAALTAQLAAHRPSPSE